MKSPLWLAVSFLMLSGSLVCRAENPDETLNTAFQKAKKVMVAGEKERADAKLNGAKAGGIPATLDACLTQAPSSPPLSKDDLAHQRNWQPLDHPVLKDQYGHIWQTALYGLSMPGQAPTNYKGFICIQNSWLETGESPSIIDTELIPSSVRLSEDGRNAYFVERHPRNQFEEFYGVSKESVIRAKTSLESATWVRASPTFANMMVVDYPRGTDSNSPRVSEALDEFEKAGLMGNLIFKDKALRTSLAKIISQKIKDDAEKYVHLYSTYDNDPEDREIAMVSYPDTIMAGGRKGLPITIKEAKAGIR